MAAKKTKSVTEVAASPASDPMEKVIQVPTKDIEALCIAVLGGNKTAAVDVVNRIRELAEPQNPEVFVRTKVAKGIPL